MEKFNSVKAGVSPAIFDRRLKKIEEEKRKKQEDEERRKQEDESAAKLEAQIKLKKAAAVQKRLHTIALKKLEAKKAGEEANKGGAEAPLKTYSKTRRGVKNSDPLNAGSSVEVVPSVKKQKYKIVPPKTINE